MGFPLQPPSPPGRETSLPHRFLYCSLGCFLAALASRSHIFGQMAYAFYGYALVWSFATFEFECKKLRAKPRQMKRKLRGVEARVKTNTVPTLNVNKLDGATPYPEKKVIFPYSFEKVCHAVWNKLRQPLPDPRAPEVIQIDTTIIRSDADFEVKKRIFLIKNEEEIPYALKFLATETVTFEEESILDKRKKTLSFVTRNQSFASYGQILDVQVYKGDPSNPDQTIYTETGEVSFFGIPSFGGVRSMGEQQVVIGFEEKFEIAINLLETRLKELYEDDDAERQTEEEPAGDDMKLLDVGQIPEHVGDMASAPAMTWAQCPDVSIFNVRGPHYVDKSHERYGVKVPSRSSLYKTVAVDMFKSDAKDLDVWRRFKRPTDLVEGSTVGVPNTLCVVQIFPNYQPSMFGTVDDGPSHNLVMWFTLAEETKQMLMGELVPTNAIQLLKEWSARGDPLHAQWKSIAQVANLEDVDAGFAANKLLRQYNGKPFLSNNSHHVINDGETLTVVSDVHTFGYMLKSYYYNNQQTVVKDAVIDLAYVIEGREGAHLPEQVLASARLHHLDISSAKTL